MPPRVLPVDPERPARAAIEEASGVLRAGGLVAFPTETVYGLGARALDPDAIARVFSAKGRPKTHPLIAHVLDEASAAALAADWTVAASRLARAFWPGPLTLVVARARHVPPAIGGGDSIAVRAPSHPVARALLAALGEPIAAPSANRYQGLSPTLASHVLASLGDAVDLVLDGGPCAHGLESTVVDARTDALEVLRPGSVDIDALAAVVPGVSHAAGVRAAPGAPRPSPGLDPRHYAPRATLTIAPSRAHAVGEAERRAARGERVGLVLRDASPVAPGIERRVLPDEPSGFARALYATLHELDALGVDRIVVEPAPADEAWRAVRDRLARASAA